MQNVAVRGENRESGEYPAGGVVAAFDRDAYAKFWRADAVERLARAAPHLGAGRAAALVDAALAIDEDVVEWILELAEDTPKVEACGDGTLRVLSIARLETVAQCGSGRR